MRNQFISLDYIPRRLRRRSYGWGGVKLKDKDWLPAFYSTPQSIGSISVLPVPLNQNGTKVDRLTPAAKVDNGDRASIYHTGERLVGMYEYAPIV
jgi:hypothetical protein